MKHIIKFTIMIPAFIIINACQNQTQESANPETTLIDESTLRGQSGVVDDESQKNIVGVAASSADHTTLVTAVQKAELVDVLSNAGPFTVFAPTNEAFDGLPDGTLDDLIKPENKEKLQDILQYHVAVAVLKTDMLKDGMKLEMVNGGFVNIKTEGENIYINDAKIIGTVNSSNGIIHVIDKVLIP